MRLNLSFFASDEEIEFLIEAVKWVAANGASLLPLYLFNRETGEWHHKDHQVRGSTAELSRELISASSLVWKLPYNCWHYRISEIDAGLVTFRIALEK